MKKNRKGNAQAISEVQCTVLEIQLLSEKCMAVTRYSKISTILLFWFKKLQRVDINMSLQK